MNKLKSRSDRSNTMLFDTYTHARDLFYLFLYESVYIDMKIF